ncbi:MAG: putative prokaryotic signal transducing protein [Phenylobacterium sp.]|nr:putative prokaryotic signal transducing protein [Phenylobacterium sp.]MDB5435357.1 putative prokaryotic signal transducing protein [Phenylobacterium sp.]MDB5463505.1 putative prokaryotic signal transducing protein [Phenylobacterium sp.]
MIAVLETHDPVRLGFLKMILEEGGLHPFVFDAGSPYRGALPSRLMVPESEAELAKHLIAQVETPGAE